MMPSTRLQQQIERLLDQAEQAIDRGDWAVVRDRCQAVLRADPGNADATAFLAMAGNAESTTKAPPIVEAAQPGDVPPVRPAGMDASAPTSPGSVRAEALEAPVSPPSLPTSFAKGRYQVKSFLGEGGKKRVYLAHDTLLDRDVAFALIKTDGLDDVGKERITREAQAMGRLGTHPHIVSVFDLGTEPLANGDGPQPFIVTELMSGGDVESLIEQAPDHRMSIERAIQIATETTLGLEFAHEKGVTVSVWSRPATAGRYPSSSPTKPIN
ncbi:MAG: hypothetical protein EXR58_06745 [Chloroflexi bacterium]|nr:hypothetical protein [Chloroflexota bacterium]